MDARCKARAILLLRRCREGGVLTRPGPHRGCSRSGAPCWLPACRWVAIRLTLHLCIHYMPSNPQFRYIAADNLWQPSSLLRLGVLTLNAFSFMKPRTPG